MILIVHQAISLPHLEMNLLNPMQLQMNDVRVSEQAKLLTEEPRNEDHALVVSGIDGGDPLLIPMSLNGVISYFPTYKPSMKQFETCRRFELTSDLPEWDPHDPSFARQEDGIIDSSGHIKERGTELNQGG